ncbi:MAG: alcohol dehydrogenase catalytic domain-containing protein [Planctomycetes bacterium]|nr:alcohol dehydrogenase catalytic domain-containing protein [Planctomycetota bacterium]
MHRRTLPELPKTMRAAVYRGRGKVRVESLPVPALKAGEVLVRVACCGVCHTDLKKIRYGLQKPPRVYGHETAGTIVRTGRGVRGWKVGDRVAVFHHVPCGDCFYCDRGAFAQCAGYKKTGTTAGFEPAGGGYAEYVRVLPWIVRGGMVRIPKGVSFEAAHFLEPLNTCYKAVERLVPARGDVALVFGQGPIGLLFTQLLKLRGAKVLALDLMPSRRRLARKLGAAEALDPRAASVQHSVDRRTKKRGADLAVVAVPSEPAAQQALNLLRPGGQVLLFAHTRRGDEIALDPSAVCVDEKTVLGSYSACPDPGGKIAQLVFRRKVKAEPLVTHRYPLARIAEAFRRAEQPDGRSLKVVVLP